jgi:hypothetical protein
MPLYDSVFSCIVNTLSRYADNRAELVPLKFLQTFNRYYDFRIQDAESSRVASTSYDMVGAALPIAVQYHNTNALEAFFETFGVSCLVGADNVNILHLVCPLVSYSVRLRQRFGNTTTLLP